MRPDTLPDALPDALPIAGAAIAALPVSPMALMAALVAAGLALAARGLLAGERDRGRAAERIAASRRRRPRLETPGPTRAPTRPQAAPARLAAGLMPASEAERYEIAQALVRAGVRGPAAVASYYGIRLVLGAGLPALFVGLVVLAETAGAPGWLAGALGGLAPLRVLQGVALLVGLGFFAPAWWLRARIARRRQAIEEAFPNMLDLLQVGIEAGLGFDQAFTQVATEMHPAAPDLAEEMFVAQSEIRAGRDREQALQAMARRTRIDTVSAFVNVVTQAARFGTPLTDALTTYAEEMRQSRELRAQEKANKLPVQMSGVMALLMLPALCGLVLAPVVIRYLAAFD